MFSRLTVKARIFMLIGGIFVLFILQFFYVLNQLHGKMMDERKVKISEIVEGISNQISHYQKLSEEGKIEQEDAKKKILDVIRHYRYEGNNYIFVLHYDGRYVLLPPKPEWEGTDQTSIKDKNGVYLLKDLISAAKEGGGYVDYLWFRGDEQDLPKISYAAGFDKWQWAIGTGVYVDDVEKTYSQLRNRMLGIFAVILFLSSFFTIYMIRVIVGRINVTTTILKDISEGEGDLTARIETDTEDEFKNMGEYFNLFAEKIEQLIISIKNSAGQVLISSQEVSSGNNQLSSSTQQMASSLEQTAASVEEITSSIRETADASARTSRDIGQTASDANEGAEMLTQMGSAMKDLGASGERIKEIVDVVNDIAFQTNLLALNAAVEAARAGEEGKGFAVVAGEVRNLAARSADAATEIRELVDNNGEYIRNATNLSEKTTQNLLKVVERIQDATRAIGEIEQRSKEQSSGIEQINTAVMQMDEVTQRNASLVEELASSAEDMSDISKKLSDEVGRFKVSEGSAPSFQKRPEKRPPAVNKPPKVGKKALPKTPEKKEEAFFDDDQFEEF